jgi:hypothetical protein
MGLIREKGTHKRKETKLSLSHDAKEAQILGQCYAYNLNQLSSLQLASSPSAASSPPASGHWFP